MTEYIVQTLRGQAQCCNPKTLLLCSDKNVWVILTAALCWQRYTPNSDLVSWFLFWPKKEKTILKVPKHLAHRGVTSETGWEDGERGVLLAAEQWLSTAYTLWPICAQMNWSVAEMQGWAEQLGKRWGGQATYDSSLAFPQGLQLIIAHMNTETHNYNQTHEKLKRRPFPRLWPHFLWHH